MPAGPPAGLSICSRADSLTSSARKGAWAYSSLRPRLTKSRATSPAGPSQRHETEAPPHTTCTGAAPSHTAHSTPGAPRTAYRHRKQRPAAKWGPGAGERGAGSGERASHRGGDGGRDLGAGSTVRAWRFPWRSRPARTTRSSSTPGARAGAGRAAGRRDLRRHRRHQHRGRARRVRPGQGVLRGAAVAARRLRAAALRRRARPRLRPAGADPGPARPRPDRRAPSRCPASGRPRTCCSGCGRPEQPPARIEVVPFPRSCPAWRDGRVRRRAGHPRGPVHLPAVRADRAGRPRRVVGGRHRPADPARRDPRPQGHGRPGARPPSWIRDVGAARPGPTRPPAATTCWRTPRRWSRTWCDQHIALYVNEFTAGPGPDGYAAADALLGRAAAAG